MPEPLKTSHALDAHQARRELRRAIPILKQHGLRQSAKFCAEQLIGLSGDGIPATNQPPPAPSARSDARITRDEASRRTRSCWPGRFLIWGIRARRRRAHGGLGPGRAAARGGAPDDAAPRDAFLWPTLYLAGEKRKEETVAETRDASAKSRVGNPYRRVAGCLRARRRRGQPQGLGAYALGMVQGARARPGPAADAARARG